MSRSADLFLPSSLKKTFGFREFRVNAMNKLLELRAHGVSRRTGQAWSYCWTRRDWKQMGCGMQVF